MTHESPPVEGSPRSKIKARGAGRRAVQKDHLNTTPSIPYLIPSKARSGINLQDLGSSHLIDISSHSPHSLHSSVPAFSILENKPNLHKQRSRPAQNITCPSISHTPEITSTRTANTSTRFFNSILQGREGGEAREEKSSNKKQQSRSKFREFEISALKKEDFGDRMASVSPVEESSAHSVGNWTRRRGRGGGGGGGEEEDEEEEGEEERMMMRRMRMRRKKEEDEVDEDEESEASQMPTRLKTPCSSPKRSVFPQDPGGGHGSDAPDSPAGESEEVATPKKRGRKPMPKEEKERLKEEKKEKRRLELLEKRKSSGEPRKKPGRKSLALTAEEKEKREKKHEKQKYEEFKKAKAEKAAKRAERNEQLRLIRKQKKEEEARQREAYEKRMQELKASFLDENTQMSSGGGIGDFVEGLQDETSQSSMSSFKKGFINEMSYMDRMRNVTAETLLEYRWPLEGKKSERKIDFEERDFLVEMKIVSEMQADLGLTAITSSEVLDIMSRDFYDKYDEYMNVISERKDRNIKQTSYNTVTVEKHHLADFVEKAVQSTADIHYPMNNRGRMKVIPKPKLGHYPISIIPDISESSSCSTCSDSSSSDSENEVSQEEEEKSPLPPSLNKNDIDKPGARCKDCQDHTDEEKMLFCDLCDRGFHIYCVGLDDVPVGRWHCSDCSYCFSCGSREPAWRWRKTDLSNPKWVVEYKPGPGSRVFSHTLCSPCHKLTKKGQYCPECNKVFGREEYFSDIIGEDSFPQELVSCWVCSRQHHSNCVGQSLFICSGCQRRTKEKKYWNR
ncbi:BAF45A [Lepeophtheirus salmonis]|uniref:BAF45A n=1 Tax=Lepeophtheirus salmonis TaxID=72036 RepID=A0A7R8HBX1_LEPSM|nr:BAF45A [Lepeophtheirus salmonis]CAF3002573.1 BAF45A [Lepeophtheirus salmonis]